MVQVRNAASQWGSSGLAYLTGLPGGHPDFSRAEVLARAEQVAATVGTHLDVTVDAAILLTGRAGLLGLTRGGRISAGGGTRLLSARDGWCALTLSRPDDIAAVPALLEVQRVPVDPWPVLQHWAATVSCPRSPSGRVCSTSRRPAWVRLQPRRRGYTRWAPGPPGAGSGTCWWPTYRRCGPGRCVGSCWPTPEPPSSKSKVHAAGRHPGRQSSILRLDER